MPNLLPYLIVLIFAAAQSGLILLLARQQRTIDLLWDETLNHNRYAKLQDISYAKLWIEISNTLNDIQKTFLLHHRMAEHYGDMSTVAEGALHTKLDEQRRYAEYTDTRLTAILDEVCAVKQALRTEELKTRQRIAQVKTRMTDEEKNDQKAKRQARAKQAK